MGAPAVFLALAAVICAIPPAESNQGFGSFPFPVDSTFQRADSVPPPAPTIAIRSIWRGHGLFYLGGGIVAQNSDRTYGTVMIDVLQPGSAEQEVGYRFHLVDGALPAPLGGFPSEAWPARVGRDKPWLSIWWSDGETWKQDPFSFRMFLTAVDRAGNESAASNIVIVEDDGILDAQFEQLQSAYEFSSLRSVDELFGNWVGKDEDGADALMSMAGRQFYVSSGTEVLEGFAQVFKDAEGKDQMTIDTGSGTTFTGPYEIKDNRLRLRLSGPSTEKSYDLRRN